MSKKRRSEYAQDASSSASSLWTSARACRAVAAGTAVSNTVKPSSRSVRMEEKSRGRRPIRPIRPDSTLMPSFMSTSQSQALNLWKLEGAAALLCPVPLYLCTSVKLFKHEI